MSPAPIAPPSRRRVPKALAASAATANVEKEPPRLARRMSELGLCSRREADEWIENGWVSVDGVLVTTLGARVSPDAKIGIAPAAKRHKPETVTLICYKPPGAPCDTANLAVAANRWPDELSTVSFKATHLRRLKLAASLDADLGGMVVFTQEDSVLRRLTGDRPRLEEEFIVRVNGELADGGLERLRSGMVLDGVRLKPAQASWQNEAQLRLVLRESQPQLIVRMCAQVGLTVADIRRIRIGSVSLGKLPPGQWRYLRDNERF